MASRLRWTALAIICIAMFCDAFAFYQPVPMQDELISTYSLSQIQYNLLFTAYTFPNIVTAAIIGILIDIIGINTLLLSTYICDIIGHTLLIIGCITSNYHLMLIGRFIFGIGAESFATARKPFICSFFSGKELGFALGINLASRRLASSINIVLTWQLFLLFGIIGAFIIGLSLLLLSMFNLSAIVCYIKQMRKNKDTLSLLSNTENNKNDANESKFSVKDIKQFDLRYWLIGLSLCLFYGASYPLLNIASSYMHNKYNYNYDTGNTLISILFITTMIGTPLFGYIEDKYGKRCQLMILSAICLIASYFILIFININNNIFYPLIAMILHGIGFSIYGAVLWAMIPLIVEEKSLGTAYGIITSLYNGAVSILTVCVGAITKHKIDGKYTNVEWLMLSISIASILVAVLLWIVDSAKDSALSMPNFNNNCTQQNISSPRKDSEVQLITTASHIDVRTQSNN